VYGLATAAQGNTIGVLGETRSFGAEAAGVEGRSQSGLGVRGLAAQGTGVRGEGGVAGIRGVSELGFGLAGETVGGTAVFGSNGGSDTTGHAAWFEGRTRVTRSMRVDGDFAFGGVLRVMGAGVNTPTPAFVHEVTSTNLIWARSQFNRQGAFHELRTIWPTWESYTMIDHPLCNNDPNAILVVAIRHQYAPGGGPSGMGPGPTTLATIYDPDGRFASVVEGPNHRRPPGRWYIYANRPIVCTAWLQTTLVYHENVTPGLVVGSKLDILVLKP
jgi:hypothetical protein